MISSVFLKVAKDLNNYSFVRLARATAMIGSLIEVNNTVRASFIYFRSVSLFVLSYECLL